MKRDNTSIGSGQEHLPLAVLRRYTEGSLPPSEEHRVEKHVLACELCADVLAGMEAQPARQTAAAVQQIRRRLAQARQKPAGKVIPLLSRQRLAVAASLLLLLCAAGVVLFYNLQQVKQQGQAPVAASSPTARELPVLRPAPPAPAVPPVAQQRPAASSADFPPAAAPGKDPVAAAPPADRQPGQQPGSGLAGPADMVVDLHPAGAQGAEKKSDSAAAQTGAIAAAPVTAAPAMAVPEEVQGGREAGGKVIISGYGRMAKSRVVGSVPVGTSVSGQVLDADGQPLPGVRVLIKGSTQGTLTDQQGRYNLPLPQNQQEATLSYHYIGYTPLEKHVKAGVPAAGVVTMHADTIALSEVVVVGYGKQNHAATANITAAAIPVGGWDSYKKYLQENLKPPLEEGRKRSGRVVVGFTVNPDGRLTDVRVLKSLSAAADAEALRLVQQGPAWQAAKAGDQALAQSLRLSIRFPRKK